jgi:pyrroline-5-carboxylate reductase
MNILLIGCGNIGFILLDVWSTANFYDEIYVIQPSMLHAAKFSKFNNIKFVPDLANVPSGFIADVTVFAFKPQQLPEILPKLQAIKRKLVISLLSAIPIQDIAIKLSDTPIIRIMPNVAIKTGKSVNLAFSAASLAPADKHQIEKIFENTGYLKWLDSETMLDKLTPITGCGPAYLFLLGQILSNETIKIGVAENIARNLVQETLLGAASLLENSDNYEELITSVASKKGVTEAALKILEPDLQQTMSEAIQAAQNRLQELKHENRS